MLNHRDHLPEPTSGPTDEIAPIAPGAAFALAAADTRQPGGFPVPFSTPPPTSSLSLAMILRAKWLILGVFALISAATVPLVWLAIHPTYRARAVVQVSARVPRIVFRTDDNTVVPLYQSYLNTQVSMILSPKVLRRVLEQSEVQATRWYQNPPKTLRVMLGGDPPTHLERLQDALEVLPRRNTELIDVSMVALSAADAKLIVDTVVDEYLQLTVEETAENERVVFEKLRQERATLQREIDGLVELNGNLSKRIGTGDPDIVRDHLARQHSELQTARENLERTHAMTLWEIESAATARKEAESTANGPETIPEPEPSRARYAVDMEWRTLSRQIETARNELNLALEQYGQAHPVIRQHRTTLDHAERLVHDREAQLDQEWLDGLVPGARPVGGAETFANRPVDLDRLAERQRAEIELLDRQLQNLESDQDLKGELAKQLAKYEQQLAHKRSIYDAVVERLTALEMEEKAPGRISIAHHAMAPSSPDRDRRAFLTLIALGVAMMAALVVGYLRVTTDQKIREACDVQFAVRVPFLGQLPPLPPSEDLIADCGPHILESMRMVRTALLERLGGTGKNVVVITSSQSRAGKTSVAILLARSLAMLGKRTLLIEGDLRRPSLADRIHLQPHAGLIALLKKTATEAEVIQSAGAGLFDVVPAGEETEDFNPELLANGALASCLAQWKKSYDYVLVDSPPVLPVADARILAGQADGTMMVLRAAHCRRSEVTQAYADLCAAGGVLLGTVLIGGHARPGYGYGYGDGYRYGYYRDRKSPSPPDRALSAPS